MSREKVTAEERIEAAKACAEGRASQAEAARKLGVNRSSVKEWVRRYRAQGVSAFQKQEHNTVYSKELKAAAVKEYLSGKDSLEGISAKYGLRSQYQLRDWIKVYNSGRDFGRKMSGGSRMKQGRETTQEELIKKYSDHIAFPIFLHYEQKKYDDKGNVTGSENKVDQINSASALWKRSKSELKEADYNEFYKTIGHDSQEPLHYVHTHAEGTQEYTTLFFVPQTAPFDMYPQRHGGPHRRSDNRNRYP